MTIYTIKQLQIAEKCNCHIQKEFEINFLHSYHKYSGKIEQNLGHNFLLWPILTTT